MKKLINRLDKKQVLMFLLMFITSLLFKSRGILKYAVYSGFSVIILLYKKGYKIKYFNILTHVFVYITIGLFLAIINNNISDETFKQSLIYLSSGYVAISYFILYGEDNTSELLDIQLYAMCSAYVILYFIYNDYKHIYWESHLFAYIFGVYVLLYLCQKRYKHLLISLIFMLFDHKRIANLSVIVVGLIILLFSLIKNEKNRKYLFYTLECLFVVSSFAWIYICKTSFLSETLHLTDRFTSLRMSLWHSAYNLYFFSPTYNGKGIGFVKNWMNVNNILGLGNLHNDFLAGYIELGFIGYASWIISFLYIFISNRKKFEKRYYIIFCLNIYMFMNFLTDNNYIYISFMLPFYIVVLSVLYGKDYNIYLKTLS